MKILLRFVAFLSLCVSLNSFGFVQSQIIELQLSTFQVDNPNYVGCDFFSDCDEPEFLSFDYIDSIGPGWNSYSLSHSENIYTQDGINNLDVTIIQLRPSYLTIDGRWGWTDSQEGLRYDSCSSSESYASGTQCNVVWNSLGLKDVTRHIDDENTLYMSARHLVRPYGNERRIIDLMVGEPIDRVSFWNDYYGYITPEEYYATTVPLPAGIYLFLSGLVGLGLMRGRNA